MQNQTTEIVRLLLMREEHSTRAAICMWYQRIVYREGLANFERKVWLPIDHHVRMTGVPGDR